MKIDLGCGNAKKEGYLGLDHSREPGVDIYCDINKGLCLDDNSVDKLYSAHCLEHVDDFIGTVKEIYRVCKDGAKLEIKVPHFSSGSAFYVHHTRFFRLDSFDDFDKKNRDMFVTNDINIEIISKRIIFDKRWYMPYNFIVEPLANLSRYVTKIYEHTFLRNLFPAFEILYKLKVNK